MTSMSDGTRRLISIHLVFGKTYKSKEKKLPLLTKLLFYNNGANQIYPIVMVPHAAQFFISARKPFKHIFPLWCEEIEKLYHKTVKTDSRNLRTK